ncbi:MAG: glycosaminoglycan attachment protein [Chloroflexi bacterium]|nr:glycosaminoglycan attachment protein [Chloroflexota bacterium]
MSNNQKTLFVPVVDQEKLNPHFVLVMTHPARAAARAMLDDVYQEFEDVDGNFLEQFQTTGFDARYFELYLHAYFSRSGFDIDRTHTSPDYIVSRNDLTVAVEATTVNPSQSGALSTSGKSVSDLTADELREYQSQELPIRFGSPLFSKLQKKYWELEQCQDLPIVLAIEAFQDDESLSFSDYALSQYLYGIMQSAEWLSDGSLRVSTFAVESHQSGDKVIPSYFFGQPDAENVSAVLFTNSGTHAKFVRMGYQHGFEAQQVSITRVGFCFNEDPDAMDPTFFSYNLAQPPFVESWGQGLVVYHNPNALHPLAREFFIDAIQVYIEDGQYSAEFPNWHPITSKTVTGYFQPPASVPPPRPPIAIVAISKSQFQATRGMEISNEHPIVMEDGWFSDDTGSFLAVVVRDKIDGDWGYVVLARDEYFQFRPIEFKSDIAHRDDARKNLQFKMADLVRESQRIFPHGVPASQDSDS